MWVPLVLPIFLASSLWGGRAEGTWISRVPTKEKVLALTFDANFHRVGAQAILDALKREGVYCTVFVTGRYIQQYPDLVKRLVADGHEVANHTLSHYRLVQKTQHLDQDQAKALLETELNQVSQSFHDLTGMTLAPFWRPPFGEQNSRIRQIAAHLGWRTILWTHGKTTEENLDLRDWVTDPTDIRYLSSTQLGEFLMSYEHRHSDGLSGVIVMMHLCHAKPLEPSAKMIPSLIEAVRSKGYRFVKVSKLVKW